MAGKTLVIAEAGVNHNGDVGLAMELADVAASCGADVVKYQAFNAEALVTVDAPRAKYQNEALGQSGSQLEMLKALELSPDDFLDLKEHCERIGISFLATSFDRESTSFLGNDIGQSMFKVPSGELDNYPYLVQIASYGKPVIMSTGMSTMDEIGASVDVLRAHGASEITLLHCNTQYPTPFRDVNLQAMRTIGETFGVKYGYSDHTLGIEVPIAAVALGASVIEKHFTLDKSMDGPDHKASADPAELKAMVAAIRNIELALGSAKKIVSESEASNKDKVRKSIVAKTHIRAGEVFTENNLTTKRPANGRSPMDWPSVIGCKASHDYAPNERIDE